MTAAHTPSLWNTLTSGTLFHQYRLLERIGVGGQGVVWSALEQNESRIYAIKFNEIPDTAEAEADNIRDEHHLEQLVKLRHVHILPLSEYGFDGQMRFTVSPYVPGGTLAEKIKTTSLSSAEILRYASEIASALDYLHSQGIIHRDLKTSNILLDLRQRVYLADFGLARLVTTSTLAFHTGHGTPPYAPPEQVLQKSITAKSDIFSFGILLYEMFTGQLPWFGKKQLGIEQTHSKQEIPDPRELNEELPELLVEVLRRVTSADRHLRPRSAEEAMKMLYYVFKTIPELESAGVLQDQAAAHGRDVANLLTHGLERWQSTNGTYNLGLTKFALIDLERGRIDLNVFGHFMLSQALTYGYNDDHWWSIVRDPRERLAVVSGLLQKKNEAITSRILEHLINDTGIREISDGLPVNMTRTLLEIGINSDNLFLRQQVFDGIRTLSQPVSKWNHSSLNVEQMKRLGVLSLEDSEAGDTAAELIGHFRSSPAVQVVLDHFDKDKKYAALLLIQQAAGSLPSFVQGSVRLRLTMEWIFHRLAQQPISLISAYVFAFLGAALGIGIQVYLTFRLPDFFDLARITTSLEQGLIIGSIFGLGIFTTRVIMERFQASSAFLRIVFGTFIGGTIMNIALFIFHVLFLNTPPMGFLITAGCALIALTFSVSGLLGSRLVRNFFSSASIYIAIVGSWLVHTNSASSSLELTPIFRYDYDWPLAQVSFTALGIAFLIGMFGNLINLSIVDE